MNLTRVDIEGFRAYRRHTSFDCAGGAVVLVGPNGFGKTSFFDAIGWALFGRIRRLTGSRDAIGDDYIRNRFVSKGPVEVRLFLSRGDENALVTRSMTSRTESRLHVVVDGNELGSREANRWIAALFRRPDHHAVATLPATERLFERCVLLPQDQLTAFIRETTPRDRFDVVAALLGVDIARDFYTHLASHLSTIEEETEDLESEVRALDQRIERTRLEKQEVEKGGSRKGRTLSVLRLELGRIVDRSGQLFDLPPRTSTKGDAHQLLQSAELIETKAVGATALVERRLEALTQLRALQPELPAARRKITRIQQRVRGLEAQLERSQAQVEGDQRTLAEANKERARLERAEAKLRAEHQDLADFLTIAESHVTGDRCPVCEQGIEPRKVLAGLARRIQQLPRELTDIAKTKDVIRRKIRRLETRIEQAASAQREIGATLDSARSETGAASDRLRVAEQLLEDAEVDSSDSSQATVRRRYAESTSRLHELRQLQRDLVGFKAEATFAASRSRLSELRSELRALQGHRRELTQTMTNAKRTGRVFSTVIRDSKRAEVDLVRDLLSRQGPLLNALYRRLRPHPILDQLEVDYKKFADRGELYFFASSHSGRANVNTIFSSAQLNAVATCLFLSLNLSHFGTDSTVALLDDPIQNMDDFNVIGLLDMLRAFLPLRQLFVATHDLALGQLISRKLRPTGIGERTIIHHLEGYDLDGPEVATEIVEHTDEPWIITRIAS